MVFQIGGVVRDEGFSIECDERSFSRLSRIVEKLASLSGVSSRA